MKPFRKQSLTLTSWNIPTPHKKNKRRSSVPVVHFSDQVHHLDSDGESLSSSLPSTSSDQHLPDFHDDFKIRPPSDSGSLGQEGEDEDLGSLRHIDELGHTLENTFKEVESIDAYVHKLRAQFDHELLSEHRFMACICSAKLARAACCRRQIKAWKDLQHELLDFCHHHHHHHHHHHQNHEELTHDPEDCEAKQQEDTSSNGSDDDEMEDLIHQLNKLPTFKRIRNRLDPKGDAKSFVEHWVLQSDHMDGVHCSDEN